MTLKSRIKKISQNLRISELSNDWTNKNIIVFGDSIVAGQELIREETPYRDVVYVKLASYYLNAHKLENFAETGTGQFKGQHNLDRLTGWIHSFEGSIQHYSRDIKQADVIIIAYGNNDWKQPNPDGSVHTLEDVKNKLRRNILHIRKINHKIQFVGVLETMAFRNHKPAWHLEGLNGFTYQEMLSAFVEVYQECNVPIFDIRDYHLGNHIDEYVDDRDHFKLAVHKQIAKSLTDFVRHDYKSPVDRFGETVKIIFEGELFENSESRRKLFNKIRELGKLGKQSEILCFMLDVNFNQKINKFLEVNSLPKNVKITNIYQYYASPLRYNGSMETLSFRDGKLYNENGVAFIQLIDDQVKLRYFVGSEWSNQMTKKQFNKNWLGHYISMKDDIFILKDDEYERIQSL